MIDNQIGKAVEVLRSGGVVVFPTDTVWGVGAAISSKEGISRLYEIKRREADKPTAVLVNDEKMAEKYGVLNGVSRELMEKYWPGGLTVVVDKRVVVPEEVCGVNGKVGLRVPDHEVVLGLIKMLGEGVVATSANFAGERPPKLRKDLDGEFLNKVDLVMGGETGGREASTVVEVVLGEMRILRQGEIKPD